MKRTAVMTGARPGISRVAAEHILRRSPHERLPVVARGTCGAQLTAELAAAGTRSRTARRTSARKTRGRPGRPS
ncbi:hypothetical protein [Streptomyces sp. NPDC050263]|uniref:hypothetical protein n=1 Tax=Streptomyces sp. NPDC050263 TaxID=3155037 RepID=UPI0034395BC9